MTTGRHTAPQSLRPGLNGCTTLRDNGDSCRAVEFSMPSLSDLIAAVRDAEEHQPDAMVTIVLPSDDQKWLQLLPDKINLAYPFDKPPREQLAELQIPNADKAIVGFWEAGLFADFETSSMSIDELSDLLNAYMVAAFRTADLDEFSVTFEVAERGTIEADSEYGFLRKIVELKRYFEGKSAKKP